MLLAGVVALILLSGCNARRVLFNERDLACGLVIVLPGIDGRAAHNEALCRTLCEEQVSMAVELYDWTLPLGPLFNQCAEAANRRAARKLAERILEYAQAYPDRPIFIISHSAGTAIAVWAAEALPEDQKITGIILLASSLSPGYELTRALLHTRQGILSFYSHLDVILLQAGTILVGTMDRKHVEAAGKVGFRAPSRQTPLRGYGKLFQIAWKPEMAKSDHRGGHFGCTAPGFAARYVLPAIRMPTWDRALIARLPVATGSHRHPGPRAARLPAARARLPRQPHRSAT